MIKRITPILVQTINQSFVKQSQPLTLSSSTQNSLKSKNPFVTSGEIKAGGGGDRGAPVKPQRRHPRWLYAAAVLSLCNTTAPPRSVTAATTEAEPSMETAAVDGGVGDANEDC
ncbi:hypothetical protein Tsubulata_033147 [Turnera subulata]|uniref:Uncharacterized protein n=1 Tax=Turnera subulata TaxID=218843 RepID=A0A9Q0JD20_9ROSI|nr:hypothetical protein Tsubulata_033147 [Turnera subulata]